MTESEWQTSIHPVKMLPFVIRLQPRCNRKLRLYGCACCRLLWHLLRDSRSKRAIEVAEAFADGRAKLKEAQAGAGAACEEMRKLLGTTCSLAEYSAARGASEVVGHFPGAAHWGSCSGQMIIGNSPERIPEAIWNHHAAHVGLLRDLFGNPFRSVWLDPAIRIPTIISLAQAAYEERIMPTGELDSVRLAVLADALDEAGADGAILDHLREPGTHVRGCWAVDRCLGKE